MEQLPGTAVLVKTTLEPAFTAYKALAVISIISYLLIYALQPQPEPYPQPYVVMVPV
jgi:hypothetical protein